MFFLIECLALIMKDSLLLLFYFLSVWKRQSRFLICLLIFCVIHGRPFLQEMSFEGINLEIPSFNVVLNSCNTFQ